MIEVAAAIIEAKYVSGEITLIDHDQYEWAYLKELEQYEFAPADIRFVKELIGR